MTVLQCKKICRSFFCWGPFPYVKNSSSTKLMNVVILVHQMLWAILIRKEIIPTRYTCPKPKKSNNYCNVNNAFMAVYIIGGNSLLIYVVYTLIHIDIKSSRDCRANWHYGFWFIKICILSVANISAIVLDNLEVVIDVQFLLYYAGYVSTVAMIVLEFVAFWKMTHKITICVLNRYNHRPKMAAMILNFIGLSLFSTPVSLGLMALYFFDSNTTKNEIFWANLFISYAFGLIYSLYNLFQNRYRSLLGGVFTVHVVLPTTVAMFQNDYKLYKTYEFTQTIYNILHGLEITTGGITLAVLVSCGLKQNPLNTEGMVTVVQEIESECCCCVKRKEIEIVVPPGVQDVATCKRAYKTLDPYSDEYTQVQYRWDAFYLICGIFLMFFSSAIVSWYEIPQETVVKDLPHYHNPNIQWAKFAASWMVAAVFVIFVLFPKLWEGSQLS